MRPSPQALPHRRAHQLCGRFRFLLIVHTWECVCNCRQPSACERWFSWDDSYFLKCGTSSSPSQKNSAHGICMSAFHTHTGTTLESALIRTHQAHNRPLEDTSAPHRQPRGRPRLPPGKCILSPKRQEGAIPCSPHPRTPAPQSPPATSSLTHRLRDVRGRVYRPRAQCLHMAAMQSGGRKAQAGRKGCSRWSPESSRSPEITHTHLAGPSRA